MNKLEEAGVEMSAKIEVFLRKYWETLEKNSRLKVEMDKFLGLRALLPPMVARQAEVTKGITANKAAAFESLGALLVKITKRAAIWAKDNNNQALAATFKLSVSSFKYQSSTKQLIQARRILDALTANAAALIAYDIDTTDINAIAASINECSDHAIAPASASNSKKAATTGIKTILANINTSLAIINDLITSKYADTDAEMVNEFLNNRKLEGKGVRHTGIVITFIDGVSGKPIENATVEIITLSKTAISNINGIAEITTMKTGTYHVNFTAANYTAQTQDINIPRGKTVELTIRMIEI